MSNDTENCTLTKEQAWNIFIEYNLFLTAFLLVITCLLQYGYATRNKAIYMIKLFMMWCFWPINIAIGAISCAFPPNHGGLIAAIILVVVACITFLGYWIQSLRLFKRCRSFWAFSPECNGVGTINLTNGMICHFSVETVPMVLSPIIKAGVLYCNGQKLVKCTPNEVPQYMYVCTPERRHVFKRAGVFSGDNKVDKKQFATFIFTKESVDAGDLVSVASSGSNLYA